MDQYPDEDEEFELRYQEELEMLEQFPPEKQGNYKPVDKPKSLVNDLVLSQPSTSKSLNGSLSTLQSPQLSQISYGFEDTAAEGCGTLAGPVNRRLFGTPKGPQRGSSTPVAPKQRMAAIQEVIEPELLQPLPAVLPWHNANTAADELQSDGLQSNKRRRRLEQDLFGDIDDIDNDNANIDYVDPMAKKARTEELRDLEMIAQIIETRQRLREASNNPKKDNLSRLNALHTFKMRNLSYTIPHWPFLPLVRSDDERVYVRFHSSDYEARAIENINVFNKGYGGLLGDNKQQIWAAANEITLKRTSMAQPQQDDVVVLSPQLGEDRLWVERYKPLKYIDLLSDESTNRSLLYWLKMWDKIVFGKEFKIKEDIVNTGQLNSFNKRTGRFESNGGWQRQRNQRNLNTNVDERGRPLQKVALLCGPPGLGKTTLAHTIARHAGYQVRELNASDDRSPDAFKLALENGTQMSAVLNSDKRPNCIILDEIDGAPRQSIEFLIKFCTDNVLSKVKVQSAGAKSQRNILKRPIICICNDIYEPALRQLRQMAFVVTFPPIESARLAERLGQIARREKLRTDFSSLIALAEKSGNDVRSCISTMQFFGGQQKKSLTLHDVLNSNLGQKDRHRGLFEVWGAVFRIQRPRKQLDKKACNGDGGDDELGQVTMTDMSVGTRARNVLDIVHSAGDYERLMQGVYENYLQQKQPDPYLNGIVEATHWFCFNDNLHRQIGQLQNYSVYPYLQYGFVAWHLLFASLAWPKITFPTRGYEFQQKSATQKNIFQAFRRGIASSAVGVGQGSVVLVDTVPLLKRILSPQLRSVAVQLLSAKEHTDLRHTVEVMADFGMTYTQVKSAVEGPSPYTFTMEPDLDTLAQFPGYPGITLTYFGRQLIAREVELEQMRRSMPKRQSNTRNTFSTSSTAATIQRRKGTSPVKQLPNHLQTLKPKQIDTNSKRSKDVMSKDFFGRIHRKTTLELAAESLPDAIVKSPIWYRYKEGFNNAVRKDVHMNELLF